MMGTKKEIDMMCDGAWVGHPTDPNAPGILVDRGPSWTVMDLLVCLVCNTLQAARATSTHFPLRTRRPGARRTASQGARTEPAEPL